MSDMWWCEHLRKPFSWTGAPEGNPYPCCQSRRPFDDVPVEDRGCGPRQIVPSDSVVVCRGPDGEWPSVALLTVLMNPITDEFTPADLLDALAEASRKETHDA